MAETRKTWPWTRTSQPGKHGLKWKPDERAATSNLGSQTRVLGRQRRTARTRKGLCCLTTSVQVCSNWTIRVINSHLSCASWSVWVSLFHVYSQQQVPTFRATSPFTPAMRNRFWVHPYPFIHSVWGCRGSASGPQIQMAPDGLPNSSTNSSGASFASHCQFSVVRPGVSWWPFGFALSFTWVSSKHHPKRRNRSTRMSANWQGLFSSSQATGAT